MLVDNNSLTISDLIENKNNLNADNALIINSPAEIFIKKNKELFDIIFFDPPFSKVDIYPFLSEIKNHLTPNGVVYLEVSEKYSGEEFKILKNSKAGKVYFYLLQ